jgi:hypothetical protein
MQRRFKTIFFTHREDIERGERSVCAFKDFHCLFAQNCRVTAVYLDVTNQSIGLYFKLIMHIP